MTWIKITEEEKKRIDMDTLIKIDDNDFKMLIFFNIYLLNCYNYRFKLLLCYNYILRL